MPMDKIRKNYPLKRSKYNVTKEKNARTYKGITYDSEMEMRYYIEIIEPLMATDIIKSCERQKKYVLIPSFKRKGTTVRAIEYVADYYIQYTNGLDEVVDIKGMPDSVAKLKRKLFWSIYPDTEYRWITYNKSHGGWVDYDELQDMKRKEKKEKEKNEDE